MSNTPEEAESQEEASFGFDKGFLDDHAGHIISDAGVAIIELIANSYDAGATEVKVQWPTEEGEELIITDNGAGMTYDEFNRRWKTLNYNRLKDPDLGEDVQFPPKVKVRPRKAFGRNGKGRHGAFCFADSYKISTTKNGQRTTARVSRTAIRSEPFHCEITNVTDEEGYGTTIVATAEKGFTEADKITKLVGSKFAVDPEFQVIINGDPITLLKLEGVCTQELDVPEAGKLVIHEVVGNKQERDTRFRGITMWVNQRMVGSPSWEGLDEQGAFLDGRTSAAKKYSFVIEADFLKEDVKPDWTGFHETKTSKATLDAVRTYVTKRLHDLLADTRKERKLKLIQEHRQAIGELPTISKKVVGSFIDSVQQNCPALSENDLSRTVKILTNLEQARSGYDLLGKLSACTPDDLDTWNRLMESWNANHAELILSELGRRLKLIEELTSLVEDETSDELHDLQPLFEKGLWIFGAEFDSAEFTSNRAMATVIRKLLGGTDEELTRRRPDIVMLPDTSIGAYSADDYDEVGDPNGVRSVVIVELKKGGFPLTRKEVRQAEDYVGEMGNANLVQNSTRITAYVLGATLGNAEKIRIGEGDNRQVIPMAYDVVLRKAHARTFQLKRKLEAIQKTESDPEIEQTLSMPEQAVMEEVEAVGT
jgi:hypothetical protein